MTRQDSTGGSTLRGQGPGTARAVAVDGSSEASAEPPTAAEALAGRSVGETSESELLSAFLPLLQGEDSPYLQLGPGDDCAVIAAPDGRFVITTDTQVEGQDFLSVWPSGAPTGGADTGAKAAAQNLADAAAMGAAPSSMVVSLTLPAQTPCQWVLDFARGLRGGIQACGAPQLSVAGGDLGGGEQISVTVTVTGDLQGREPVRRSGAAPGQRLVLAGTVGRAAAGLALLLSSDYRPGEDAVLDEIAGWQLRPVSPVPAGARLAQAGATAMIDVSDGLVRDGGRIASASGVHLELDPQSLQELAEPLWPAAELLGADPLDWVLAGGEDHGLLACLPADAQVPEGVRAIGSVRLPGAPSGGPAAGPPGRAQPQEPVGGWDVSVAGDDANQLIGRSRSGGWDHFERPQHSEHGGRSAMARPRRP